MAKWLSVVKTKKEAPRGQKSSRPPDRRPTKSRSFMTLSRAARASAEVRQSRTPLPAPGRRL